MKKFLLFVFVALAFAACTQDIVVDITPEPIVDEVPETLVVGFEGDDTRIQLNEAQKTVWTKGDLVSVFYRSDANQQWKFQGNTGDRSGTIKRVSTPEYSHTTSKMVVAYPYNENYYLNPETCNLQAFLPAEQTYLKDSYGINGNIMVSQSEYKQFILKSVCGWLKIQLKGEGQVVKKVTLKGNNGEQVAGEIYVNTADATSILAAEMGFSSDHTQVGGTMVEDDTVLTEVTLNCPNGVTLSSTAKAFYIALPPQTFAKGLSVEVSCSDESVMTKSTDSSITIGRNSIQPMAALTYDGVVPEVYELVYTTNNGQPLDPYTTEGFGANFVENTYDATTGIGSLKFDAQMTYIPDRAFVGCSNLTSINLTKQIKRIGIEAFNGCSALAVMEIPGSVYSIGDKAFYHCSGMQEITIPKGVSIGVSSFEGCSGKANINCSIPYGYYAAGKFYKANFNEVVLGEGITSIGSWGFYCCSNIKKISIPNSLTYIEGEAFADCGNIEQVNISSLESWCKISFGNGSAHPAGQNTKLFLAGEELIDVVIPESVTNIAPYAFYEIKSIKSVTMHDKVSYIGEFAFYKCNSLSSVTNGNRVTSIGTYAFYYCTNLSSITIGNRVTTIGKDAFFNCDSLTSVIIPDSVTTIGDYAFNSCDSLTSVTIGNSVTTIGECAFRGCSKLREFTGKYAADGGRCLIIDNTIIAYAEASGTTYNIPESVTTIGNDAFACCGSLTSVNIPDSITTIGDYAFWYCTNLKYVYCKATTPPALDGWYVFDGNASGRRIIVPIGSGEAYKTATYWKEYANDIFEDEF